MCLKMIQAFLSCFIVCIVAYEDMIYVYGQVSQEMVEQGRLQYQRLQERGSLPHFGTCWKSALEHVEDGCRNLSEETQSDVALHLTNCFLEMSGHQIYNCELDKKPNLRRICIASMSDRAFGVYTEFYTHSQNICWFLRGQVWHETIAENTLRVGKQLEASAKNQDEILQGQKESLVLQEKLLHYGRNLEKIMEDFYLSTQQHQEILSVMSNSLGNLQSWLVGELSWLDLIIFYVTSAILIVIFTSGFRTAPARLPLLFLLMMNAVIERTIYSIMSSRGLETDIHLVQNDIYAYIWWSRKTFVVVAISILVYKFCMYKDLTKINNVLLQKIYNQNLSMCDMLDKIRRNQSDPIKEEISFIRESSIVKENSNDCDLEMSRSFKQNNYVKHREQVINNELTYTNGFIHSSRTDTKDINIYKNNLDRNGVNNGTIDSSNKYNSSRLIRGRESLSRLTPDVQTNGRYNLRSRQGTPDSRI